MDKTEVLKLAKLARIEVSEKEAENLSGEFDAILGYVGEVKKVSDTKNIKKVSDTFFIRNVTRKDDVPHVSGLYTKEILEQAPNKEGDYIKVKKIL